MEEREEINRVEQDREQWERDNPRRRADRLQHSDRKLEFLERLTDKHKNEELSPAEKKAMQRAERERSNLQKRIQPWAVERYFGHFRNPVARFLAQFLKAFRQQIFAARPERPARTKKTAKKQPEKKPKAVRPE